MRERALWYLHVSVQEVTLNQVWRRSSRRPWGFRGGADRRRASRWDTIQELFNASLFHVVLLVKLKSNIIKIIIHKNVAGYTRPMHLHSFHRCLWRPVHRSTPQQMVVKWLVWITGLLDLVTDIWWLLSPESAPSCSSSYLDTPLSGIICPVLPLLPCCFWHLVIKL